MYPARDICNDPLVSVINIYIWQIWEDPDDRAFMFVNDHMRGYGICIHLTDGL